VPNAGAFDYIDIRFRASVADRWFFSRPFSTVTLSTPIARYVCQHMLDCMHAHRSVTAVFARSTFEIVDLGVDVGSSANPCALNLIPLSAAPVQFQRNFLPVFSDVR